MTVLIALNGVLRSDANTPIREGRMLYDALVSDYRVVIMADETTEKTEHWLVQYGVKGYAGLLTPSVMLTDEDPLRPRQIATARSLGRVDLVVDANPVVVEHCLDIEVPALLFAHPKTSKPEWRPDGARRTWDEITTLLEKQREKEAAQ
jgi:hypothetical protein